MKKNIDFEEQARILASVACASRVWIIHELSVSGRTVGELTEILGLDISTISRHLNTLSKSGLVLRRREGKQVRYSLKDKTVMDCIEQLFVIASVSGEEPTWREKAGSKALTDRKRKTIRKKRRLSKHGIIRLYQ